MHITGVSIPTFKKWLYRGRRQRQPFANYVEIQKNRLNESVSISDEPDFLKWKPVVRNSMMNLKNTETGELLSNKWYAWCGHMIEGLAIVMDNDGKYNYLKDNGEILLDEWYDDVSEFKDGNAVITREETVDGDTITFINHIDRNGNILGDWEISN